MDQLSITGADIQILAAQLGRTPRGVRAVLTRCRDGYPEVVLNSPLLSAEEPFPTVYWLTCPLLVKEIAVLENEGWIARFQSMIEQDASSREAFAGAQAAYRESRKRMVTEIRALPAYAEEVLARVGIGGVADLSKVKCLHAHYAHFLATGANPIGEKLHELIGETVCTEGCVVK